MKLMKRFSTVLMALVLMLAMTINVFANSEPTSDTETSDPAYSITVNNTNKNITIDGKTYTAYKLFDATYSGNAVSYTIKKDSYFYKTAAAKTVLEEYFNFTAVAGDTSIMSVTPKDGFNEAKARELADKLQPHIAGATKAADAKASGETATIALTEPGYYLVDGNADPKAEGSTGEIVAAVALTTAKPTATVNPKADAPSVDKKIKKIANGTEKVESDGKTGNGSVGEKVEYELSSKVPNMTGYESYQFVYTDTMSKGLTFNDDIAITIDGSTYTAFTKEVTTNASTGETTIKITFTNFIAQAANAGKDIKITYSATINEEAVTRNKEDNTVKLKYSNNPYDDKAGTPDEVLGETPESKTEVYDTNIELTKVDEKGGKLTGAKFKIEGNSSKVNVINSEVYKEDTTGTWYRLKDGTYTETAPTAATNAQYDGETKYAKVTEINKDKVNDTYVAEGWVKSDSTLSFNGLGEGTYTITEIVAPEGYNLLSQPISVVVTFDADSKAFTATVDGEDATITNNVIKLDVKNKQGNELPSTGGMGTRVFYILGTVLVLGAGIILVSRKRASSK